MASELSKRVAVAVVAIPVVLALVYAGGWWLGGLLGGAAVLGVLELYRLAEARGARPFRVAGAVLAAGLVAVATAVPSVGAATPLFWTAILLATLLLGAGAIWARGVDGNPLAAVSITLFGALLLGGTLSYGMFLRYFPLPGVAVGGVAGGTGVALVLFPLVLTWVSDSGAYFGGRALGRRKLIPTVSPGKTVAGAVCGLLATIAAGVLAAWLLTARFGLELSLGEGALGGALISLVAQVGDLAESLLKREARVKDSGRFFPGHGGVFDRVDALLFAIPTAFWFLVVVL
ncbi:MAG: phosphatidate cytidylyltransferase [Gemmatimonadetes bacterium]|nr:phosphatidate cytidylyltransferase [Gemmatimonadota bacterium]